MKTKIMVMGVLAVFFLSVGPQQEAHAGVFDQSCFAGPPIGGGQPNPTVGCSIVWGPGGTANLFIWSVLFECAAVNCNAASPGVFSAFYSVFPSGLRVAQIRSNCTNSVQTAFANAVAQGLIFNFSTGTAINVQESEKTSGGLVPVFCAPSSDPARLG